MHNTSVEMNCDPNLETKDSVFEDLKYQIKLIEKSTLSKEKYNDISKVLRNISKSRKLIDDKVLSQLVNHVYPNECLERMCFTECLETDLVLSSLTDSTTVLPEVEIYLNLLVLIHLIDSERSEKAIQWSNSLVEKLSKYNRRSMDILAAKCYFYYSLSHEKYGDLETIRTVLYSRLRTCTLRKDVCGQTMTINLLLQNCLKYNLYDQANQLVCKVNYPEEASNNDLSTYLYYLGRIKAIQLDYSAAHKHLISALRKAPQNGAIGFKQTVHKLNVVVELLLGERPDRAVFRDPSLKNCLLPYFHLTKVVHAGDLCQFNDIFDMYKNTFLSDNTYTLIVRMRNNVIKTGIKLIASSYSCISLESMTKKLQLESCEDTEFIIAKAIKDNVISATIDNERGYVITKELQDVYSTGDPLNQFHERIQFSHDIRNQSVKAMRYLSKKSCEETKAVPEEVQMELSDYEFED